MESNTQPPAPPAAIRPVHQHRQLNKLPVFMYQHRQPNKLPVFRPPVHQDGQPNKLAVFKLSVPAIAPQGSTVLSAVVLGVGRPPAPLPAMMANPWPRFMPVSNRLTLRDLQLQPAELSVYRGSVPSGTALLQSSVDTGPCTLNLQADLPSPDELSEGDSGSEDELELKL